MEIRTFEKSAVNIGVNSKSTELSKSRKNKEQASAFMFLLPALVLFALFKYYPILQGFFISFFEIDIVNLPGRFVGFDNYIRAFSDTNFYGALLHNIYFWVVGLIMNFWPPIVLALLIDELRKCKTLLRTLYFIPAEIGRAHV